jgi:steroid delta-isomerase-like uncharacterized protein
MSIEESKTLVRRYFEEALNKAELYDELLNDDFQVHTIHHATVISDEGSGPPAFKTFAAWLHSVWSDARMTVEEMIAEGDRVMAYWTFCGKHSGEFFGVPPTGKQVSYSGITIFRVADGKLAEGWALFDRLWLWQQLGVVPETAEFLARAKK